MKKWKILLLGALALSGTLAFTNPASAADRRYDYRRAEINREYREAVRRREALERNHRFGWWNRDNHADAWRYRNDWRNHRWWR